MAKSKVTLSRIPRKRPKFPEVKGKIVHDVEVNITDYGCAIGIMFQDRTYLCFEVDIGGLTVLPDMSSWKSGNYKPMKRWRAITS
jgi:hypothetical protein